MDDCLFCKIAGSEIPASKVYEDELVLAFNDIDPQAPTHVLIIPKAHFADIMEATEEYTAAMYAAARSIAREKGLDRSGFRLVINTGSDGGQTVPHLHMHLLGGRSLGWPPG